MIDSPIVYMLQAGAINCVLPSKRGGYLSHTNDTHDTPLIQFVDRLPNVLDVYDDEGYMQIVIERQTVMPPASARAQPIIDALKARFKVEAVQDTNRFWAIAQRRNKSA